MMALNTLGKTDTAYKKGRCDMKFNVEYRAWIYFEVEADSVDEAIYKADTINDEFCKRTPEVSCTELSYANWEDGDGNFYEEDFNY